MATLGALRTLSLRSVPVRFLRVPPTFSLVQSPAANNFIQWQRRSRQYATESASQVQPPDYMSEGERKVFDMIKEGLEPVKLEVQDISGGCGSMYALDIVSEHFKGLPIIKQHRMVNKVLGDEMKKWHGVQLKTKAP